MRRQEGRARAGKDRLPPGGQEGRGPKGMAIEPRQTHRPDRAGLRRGPLGLCEGFPCGSTGLFVGERGGDGQCNPTGQRDPRAGSVTHRAGGALPFRSLPRGQCSPPCKRASWSGLSWGGVTLPGRALGPREARIALRKGQGRRLPATGLQQA